MTNVSVMQLTLRTAIRTDDVLTALDYMGLLKEAVPPVTGHYIDCTNEALEACAHKIGSSTGPKVKPELLHWYVSCGRCNLPQKN